MGNCEIELVAEYSRFSRSVIAASLVIPAIASTDRKVDPCYLQV